MNKKSGFQKQAAKERKVARAAEKQIERERKAKLAAQVRREQAMKSALEHPSREM